MSTSTNPTPNPTALADVVDMAAEPECDLWEEDPCERPARFRVFFVHEDDDSRCTPEIACDVHLAELAPLADVRTWGCQHGRSVYPATWRQL